MGYLAKIHPAIMEAFIEELKQEKPPLLITVAEVNGIPTNDALVIAELYGIHHSNN